MMTIKKSVTKTNKLILHPLSQPYIAKYLVVVTERGVASEINYFNSLKEAKQAFGEIADDYGYDPGQINGSDYYDVSIWEWTEDRYEKVDCYL